MKEGREGMCNEIHILRTIGFSFMFRVQRNESAGDEVEAAATSAIVRKYTNTEQPIIIIDRDRNALPFRHFRVLFIYQLGLWKY